MAKKPLTTGEAAPNVAIDPVGPSLEDLTASGRRSLLAMARLHSRLMRNALELNAELLDFAHRRVEEDISASEKLSHSRSRAEAAEVMNGFYQKALKDYAEEAERMMQIGVDAARRSIEETQAEADEALRCGFPPVAFPELQVDRPAGWI